MMRGSELDLSKEELNSFFVEDFDSDEYYDYVGTPLYGSEGFRRQCIDSGFVLESLYPIYYQGWEMDEWGATGTKDGNTYILETNHGSLCPVEMPSTLGNKVRKAIAKWLE